MLQSVFTNARERLEKDGYLPSSDDSMSDDDDVGNADSDDDQEEEDDEEEDEEEAHSKYIFHFCLCYQWKMLIPVCPDIALRMSF